MKISRDELKLSHWGGMKQNVGNIYFEAMEIVSKTCLYK